MSSEMPPNVKMRCASMRRKSVFLLVHPLASYNNNPSFKSCSIDCKRPSTSLRTPCLNERIQDELVFMEPWIFNASALPDCSPPLNQSRRLPACKQVPNTNGTREIVVMQWNKTMVPALFRTGCMRLACLPDTHFPDGSPLFYYHRHLKADTSALAMNCSENPECKGWVPDGRRMSPSQLPDSLSFLKTHISTNQSRPDAPALVIFSFTAMGLSLFEGFRLLVNDSVFMPLMRTTLPQVSVAVQLPPSPSHYVLQWELYRIGIPVEAHPSMYTMMLKNAYFTDQPAFDGLGMNARDSYVPVGPGSPLPSQNNNTTTPTHTRRYFFPWSAVFSVISTGLMAVGMLYVWKNRGYLRRQFDAQIRPRLPSRLAQWIPWGQRYRQLNASDYMEMETVHGFDDQ